MRRRPHVGFSRAMLSDQVAKLGVEPRAADRVGSGLPPPVELEALAVPGEDGGRLHDDEAGPPARPDGVDSQTQRTRSHRARAWSAQRTAGGSMS